MEVKLLYGYVRCTCPHCRISSSVMNMYLDYAETPHEVYKCSNCGKEFYRIAQIMTTSIITHDKMSPNEKIKMYKETINTLNKHIKSIEEKYNTKV